MDCNWTETGSPLCVFCDDSLRYGISKDASVIYKEQLDNRKVYYTLAKQCPSNIGDNILHL